MSGVIDIEWWQLVLFSTILIIPLGISYFHQLELGKEMLIAIFRMGVQLSLVGIYLNYLFEHDNILVNTLWLLIMIVIGASSVLSKANLPLFPLFSSIATGLLLAMIPMIILLCAVVVRPSPLFSAQYMIPLAGMLLGNSLSGNIVALQNLFSAYQQRRSEYEAALSLGASPQYASRPFVRSAMKKSMAPLLASMATIGLVTLPGMMTGQILGGASPLIAVKYQLMIMIAIFVMLNLSLTIAMHLTLRTALTKEGRVKVKFLKEE